MKVQYFLLSIILLFLLANMFACKHSPILLDDEDVITPIDTTDTPIDTTDNPIDTTSTTPCDPDIVYFDKDILPILISNCAFSGCHDADSAQDGVILTGYEKVIQTADVEPFDINDSKIYEVLVEDDEDKRMPPTPTNRLDQDKIQLIAKWILQGAEYLDCDPDAEGCETENISFSADVKPVLEANCVGCHSGGAPSGGVSLGSYEGVKVAAENGRLHGAIAQESGFTPMPQGGEKLSDCTVDKIKSWIDAGALNN